MIESRLTIAQALTIEIDKIKGSRFIATAFPVAQRAQMEERVKALWLDHSEACHICWAYRGAHTDDIRTVDDGEPSGTAGRPILNIIEGRGLESIGVAVVRYFGGTKLGTGGLARAYSAAAQAVLSEAEQVHLQLRCVVSFEISYSFEGSLLYLLEQREAVVEERLYTTGVKIIATLLYEGVEEIIREVNERTAGQAKIDLGEPHWS